MSTDSENKEQQQDAKAPRAGKTITITIEDSGAIGMDWDMSVMTPLEVFGAITLIQSDMGMNLTGQGIPMGLLAGEPEQEN